MREIWMMQPRFERRTPSAAASLVDQPRFRAGYDFLRLRCEIDEVDVELADWWEEFSLASDDDRAVLLQGVRASQVFASTRKRSPGLTEEPSQEERTGAPARRRRRRRRRSGHADASAQADPAVRDGSSPSE